MSKRASITIVYLDLLFALFAALTMVNLILAITKGRTPHQLEKDFVVIRIDWADSVREVENYPYQTRRFALARSGAFDGPEWMHAQGATTNRTSPPRSVFIAPALGGRAWEFAPADIAASELLRMYAIAVEVRTRSGPKLFHPGRSGAGAVRFETEPTR